MSANANKDSKKSDFKDKAAKPALTIAKVTPAVTSLIERHSTRLTAPAPRHDTHPVVIRVANYQPWLISLYESITNGLYSGYPIPLNIIQIHDFVRGSMILIAEKMMLVHAYATNARIAFRPRFLNRMYVPTSLALVLNGIGLHMVKNSAYQIYPELDATVTQAYYDQYFINAVEGNLTTEYNKLTNNAAIKNCATCTYAGLSPMGNASWCLSVFNAADNAIANGDVESVAVRSIFTEATEDDVIIAAIVQNRFPGSLADANIEMTYEWNTYNGVSGMREYFNTHP